MWQAGRPAADESPEPDPACEAVIDIALAHPVAGESLPRPCGPSAASAKSPCACSRNAKAAVIGPRRCRAESYTSLQLAVVLANRSGPLTAIEWSNLWTLWPRIWPSVSRA